MKHNVKTEGDLKIKGEYWAFSLPDIQEDSPILKDLREQVRNNNVTTPHQYFTNLIPTSGRSVLARLLTGDTTYTGEITDGALGNGASPSFTNSSTTLVNEVYRNVASSQSRDNAIAYVDFFYAAGDVADQTFTEFGTFIDGDGSTADDGEAWSLTAVEIIKNGSLFVSCRFTLS